MAGDTPQQRLYRAYRESRGQVYLFNLGAWMRQNHGLNFWLKESSQLLDLTDGQAEAALEALPAFTARLTHVPTKALVLASLRRTGS